jgi:hypothetical protein
MVHVRMRDEGVAYPEKRTRRERLKIAEVKKHGAPMKLEIEQDSWIAERIVDELGMYNRCHRPARIQVTLTNLEN